LAIAQCILDCGPPTERFLGVLGQFIHTAKNPGKNLARNIEFLEDYKLLKMINPSDLSHYSTTRKMMMMLLKIPPVQSASNITLPTFQLAGDQARVFKEKYPSVRTSRGQKNPFYYIRKLYD